MHEQKTIPDRLGVVFERQALEQADTPQIPERARRMARRRSFATLTIFTSAMLVALFAPRIGFALICCALIFYLTPETPGPWLRALVRPSSRRSSSPGHGR